MPPRQYRACVVDSLGLGITCLISQYSLYKAYLSCLLCFLCHPYIPRYNFNLLVYFNFLIIVNIVEASVEFSASAFTSIEESEVANVCVTLLDSIERSVTVTLFTTQQSED